MAELNKKFKKETSWGKVAEWYDSSIRDKEDTYQRKVITPNLIRFLDIIPVEKGREKQQEKVLDVACGQGFITNEIKKAGASIIGVDISSELIEKARAQYPDISWYTAPAHRLGTFKEGTFSTVTLISAIQNIAEVDEMLTEFSRILKNNGRAVIVMNHPAFRPQQHSDWGFDNTKGIQYRRIDGYMSEMKIKIDMNPGEKNPKKKIYTITFHRPLQWYTKLFWKHGFAITRMEEWISHKESGSGPRKDAEDKARKEIPMFLCLEIKKL